VRAREGRSRSSSAAPSTPSFPRDRSSIAQTARLTKVLRRAQLPERQQVGARSSPAVKRRRRRATNHAVATVELAISARHNGAPSSTMALALLALTPNRHR